MASINLYRHTTFTNLVPAGEDYFTDYGSGDPEFVLHLAEGVTSYPDPHDYDRFGHGSTVLSHPDGETIELSKAFTPWGKLINHKWGHAERI
jgi:hypothetical protein